MNHLKNKTVCFMLTSIMMYATISYSQTTRNLTLQEAVQLSLSNSKHLKSSQATIDVANAQVQSAKMNQLPDIKVSGAYMRLKNPNIDLEIPLGNSSKDTSGSQTPNKGSSPTANQMMYGMVNASLPIFSGLRIRNGIEAAKYLKKATELSVEKDKTAVIQNTIAAYYNLYKANKAVALMKENLATANSRVQQLSNMEANGLLARNDLLKAELQQSNIELALADAENNQQIAQYSLNLILGLADSTILTLDSVQNEPIALNKSLAEWQQTALSHRGDYLSVQQKQMAAHKNIDIAKGAYYPSFAITGGYVAGKVPNIITITNAMNIGVGISYNIAELYKNGSKVKAAKAQENQIYWASEELNDAIRIQVYQAYNNYNEALKKINVYQKAVEQANENYRITKNKFDNSLETTTNLLDADVAQLQANINYQYAIIDAIVAYNKLFETAGITNTSISK